MTTLFDPSRAIVFDVARGHLRDDEGSARLNLPATALLRLCEQAGADAQKDFAQSLGTDVGRRIADRLGKATSDAPLSTWVSHLGGHLALLGFGDLMIEQWGKALVLVVSGAPDGSSGLIGQLLSAALQRALGRDTRLVEFSGDSRISFLVVSPATLEKVEGLRGSGAGLGQVVEELHRGAA